MEEQCLSVDQSSKQPCPIFQDRHPHVHISLTSPASPLPCCRTPTHLRPCTSEKQTTVMPRLNQHSPRCKSRERCHTTSPPLPFQSRRQAMPTGQTRGRPQTLPRQHARHPKHIRSPPSNLAATHGSLPVPTAPSDTRLNGRYTLSDTSSLLKFRVRPALPSNISLFQTTPPSRKVRPSSQVPAGSSPPRRAAAIADTRGWITRAWPHAVVVARRSACGRDVWRRRGEALAVAGFADLLLSSLAVVSWLPLLQRVGRPWLPAGKRVFASGRGLFGGWGRHAVL